MKKLILALALCLLLPLGALAVKGAEDEILENFATETFTGGYDSTVFLYITPGVTDTWKYSISENLGRIDIPEYDPEKWVFEGWRTWYTGTNFFVTSDKANPKYDDNENYFTVSTNGFVSQGEYYKPGAMMVLKEDLWDGTYFISAVFSPIVEVNAEGADYTFTGADLGNDRYKVKYAAAARAAYTPRQGHVITGAHGLWAGSYTAEEAVINSVDRPGTLNIRTRLKEMKVEFDPNGGVGEMPGQTFQYGVSRALTANRFTREGYTFEGWGDYADEQQVTFTPENDGDTVTLYAQWREAPVTRVLRFYDENGLYMTLTLTDGERVTMPAPPEKAGYTAAWDQTVEIADRDYDIRAVYTPLPPATGDGARPMLWAVLLMGTAVLVKRLIRKTA